MKLSAIYGVTYDVDLARKMGSRDHEVFDVPIEKLRGVVDYPPAEGEIDIFKMSVHEEHIDHVNLDDPIIIAYSPPVLPHETGIKRTMVVIDGMHRIAKSIKHNLPTVKTVVLTEDETDRIITDHRPGLKKKTAKYKSPKKMPKKKTR